MRAVMELSGSNLFEALKFRDTSCGKNSLLERGISAIKTFKSKSRVTFFLLRVIVVVKGWTSSVIDTPETRINNETKGAKLATKTHYSDKHFGRVLSHHSDPSLADRQFGSSADSVKWLAKKRGVVPAMQ